MVSKRAHLKKRRAIMARRQAAIAKREREEAEKQRLAELRARDKQKELEAHPQAKAAPVTPSTPDDTTSNTDTSSSITVSQVKARKHSLRAGKLHSIAEQLKPDTNDESTMSKSAVNTSSASIMNRVIALIVAAATLGSLAIAGFASM